MLLHPENNPTQIGSYRLFYVRADHDPSSLSLLIEEEEGHYYVGYYGIDQVEFSPQEALALLDWLTMQRPLLEQLVAMKTGKGKEERQEEQALL